MDPKGKVAVVTGGSSGLGEAVGRALAHAGATVVSLDLRPPSAGEPLGFVSCDVTDAGSAERAVAEVIERHGRIDVLANCAGIGGIGQIATPEGPQDLDDFRRVIDVNLIGVVNVTRLVAHRMMSNPGDGPDAERGVIVNAASVASFEGQQGMGAYTASKAALHGLTLVWARDLSAHHIRVVSIAAGFFATPMTAGLPQAFVDDLVRTLEFPQRPGRPEEFADLALFLVRSPYINGETVRLDAGTRPPPRTLWTAG